MSTTIAHRIQTKEHVQCCNDNVMLEEEDEEENEEEEVSGMIISPKYILLKMLTDFFASETNLATMLHLIKDKSPISLRLIDWFVTNYSKLHGTSYMLSSGTRFEVHTAYKSQLKGYRKNHFDPFCRSKRISLMVTEEGRLVEYDKTTNPQPAQVISTTLGQMNFFKWVINNQILDYITEHYAEIDADMKERGSLSKRRGDSASAQQQQQQGSKTRKKREELSISATKQIKREKIEIVLKFT